MHGPAGSQSWDMRLTGKKRRLTAAAGFANDHLVSVTRIVHAGGLDRQTPPRRADVLAGSLWIQARERPPDVAGDLKARVPIFALPAPRFGINIT
jgi:hypothetical protein